MRFHVIAFHFILPLCAVSGRNAIQYFVTHSNLKHTFITMLEKGDNSTKKWVEYQYVFRSKESKVKELSDNMKIGIIVSKEMDYDFLGCRLSSNNRNVTGYNNDVIEHLKEMLHIKTEFHLLEDLTNLTRREVDLVICYPSSQSMVADVVELDPILEDNLLLIYKPARLNLTKDIFILTFAGSLWVVFLGIMILLAVCLRLSTQKLSKIPGTEYDSWTWVEITLWAIAAACQQGLSHTPSGFASCLIFFLGYSMAYLLYTGFAAGITSILVENVDTNVQLSHLRLDKQHLITPKVTNSYLKGFKEQFLVTEVVNDLRELFKQLDRNDRIGVGPEISVQQYMANNFNYYQVSSYQSMKLNISYRKGFLIRKDSAWRKIINKNIIALAESGVLQNILRRNLRPAPTLNMKSGYSSAGREHVNSAILLFLGGVLISLLFLAAEFVLYLYQRNHGTNKN